MRTGEKIKQLRKANGLSQEQLAEQLSLSRQAISQWENDNALPETGAILKLSEFFSVSTDYLLRDAEKRNSLKEALSSLETLQLQIKQVLIGGFLMSAGAIGIGFISAAAMINPVNGWVTPPGRFLCTIFDSGAWASVLLFGILLLSGLSLLLYQSIKKNR